MAHHSARVVDSFSPWASSSQGDVPRPTRSFALNVDAKKSLGVYGLAALTFFSVSGGPYGMEEMVASGGPLGTLVILLLVPWLWGWPMALITAELGTMFPEMGGAIRWVDHAFGPFWAYSNGVWKTACNVIDEILYPNLFIFYLQDLTGDLPYSTRVGTSFGLIAFVCILNIVGVDVVSDASTVFIIMTLLPFGVMVLYGTARGGVDPSDWVKGPNNGSVGITTLITIALWKTSGYDNVGSCASEVNDPATAFPQAMRLTIAVVTLVYVLPILVGVSYATDYSLWTDGYLVQVAKAVSDSDWLGVWVTVTGSVTSLAMLNTTICTSSRAIQSMAALGYFPRFLSKLHSKFKTPAPAVVVNGVLVFLLVLPDLDFPQIANISMFFYALTIFLLVSAFVRLRRTHARVFRPYRVRFDGWRLLLFVAFPPILCSITLLVISSLTTWVIGLAIVLATFILWRPVSRWRARRLGVSREGWPARPSPPVVFEGHSENTVQLRGPFANV